MTILHKQVRIKRYVLLAYLMACTHLSAQELTDSIISHFRTINSIPQEKLYLHLDKPFYGAGENIWFKAYLLNAITHRNNTMSNFFIAELVNRRDSVVQRKKIRKDSLGFVGSFTLPAELPQGDYHLRAYSNWMLNADPDFHYQRNIQIGNSIDVSILSTIQYQQEDEENYIAKVTFTDQENKPFVKTKIRYALYDDNRMLKKGNATTDEYGTIRLPISDLQQNSHKKVLDVSFNHPEYKYSNSFYLPNRSTDFDLSFFPEGGHLLEGTPQIIAFKSLGADGFSKEVSGTIFNDRGDSITHFASEHNGMGIFNFLVNANEHYYAEVTSADGIKKQFELPAAQKEGFSISVSKLRENIRFMVQKTPSTPPPNRLFLLVHTRGRLLVLKELSIDVPYGKIEANMLGEGINHFLVVNETGAPVCERLYFVRHSQHPSWTITPDKERYERREKATIHIAATDKEGNPLQGDFSVSITDAGSVKVDSLADNIYSNLLLTSDLKGHIENAGYYFLNPNKKTERGLDLLMLTHGWKRFQTDSLTQKPRINTKHFLEVGQSVSGRVKGLFGGKVKKGKLIAFIPKLAMVEMVETDDQGKFLVEGISFPDSTAITIQARTRKGFAGVDIEIDSTEYAPSYNKNAYKATPIRFMDDYLVNTREKYYYEGGERVINLKEVVIKAQRKQSPSSSANSMYTSFSDHTLSSERLEEMAGSTIYNILSHLPGVQVSGNDISIRGSMTPPAIVIDGFVYEEADILETIHLQDIERIDLLRGANASILGSRGGGGAIIIELKVGGQAAPLPPRGLTVFTPLGYSPYTEFYHPKYDTPERRRNSQPDLRTTIYWNPTLTLDEEGKAEIEFYNSDTAPRHHIEIEGIDANGNVCRYSGKL